MGKVIPFTAARMARKSNEELSVDHESIGYYVLELIEDGLQKDAFSVVRNLHHDNETDLVGDILNILALENQKSFIMSLFILGVDVDSRDSFQETMLHKAASCDNYEMMKFLLKNGASPNSQSIDGETPLMIIGSSGSKKSAALLLAHGANKKLRDGSGKTAVDYALTYQNLSILQLLNQESAHA